MSTSETHIVDLFCGAGGKFSFRKLLAGCSGFVVGLFAAPILLVASPFFFAWYLYNEEDM